MTNETENSIEVKLQIINSLNQSKEKWFELLKGSIENEEARNTLIEKIDALDERLLV